MYAALPTVGRRRGEGEMVRGEEGRGKRNEERGHGRTGEE